MLVEDQQIRQAMRRLLDEVKIVVEPAGAASTAGLLGPFKKRCQGKKVGVIVCGSNIDLQAFFNLVNGI